MAGENGKAPALHALLAVRKDLMTRANGIADETKKVLKGKHFFNGSHKSYSPFEADAVNEHMTAEPDEVSKLTYTVGEQLEWFFSEINRAVDLDFQIDKTNQMAKTTLVIGEGEDKIEIADVPVAFLMDAETWWTKIRQVLQSCQVLDPKVDWAPAEDLGEGVWRNAVDTTTYRTKLMHHHKTLAAATEHHPEQVKEWTEDTRIGRYTTKFTSGAITDVQKSRLLAAVDEVLTAIKKALSMGNQVEHSKDTIGKQLTDYVLQKSGIKTGGVAKSD
jgi:hypothetical protein